LGDNCRHGRDRLPVGHFRHGGGLILIGVLLVLLPLPKPWRCMR